VNSSRILPLFSMLWNHSRYNTNIFHNSKQNCLELMTIDNNKGYTRGKGLLEPLLARLRAAKANDLIPQHLRTGRILDIGCGTYPYFLAHTSFEKKFAVDQIPMPTQVASTFDIKNFTLNLNEKPMLPFGDNFFNVVTLLAVVEHLDPESMAILFTETHRVICQGGVVIMTTPAAWSDGLLRTMARMGLVSAEEIHEHTYAYTLPLLGWYFGQSGFKMQKIKFGYFEFGLNMWAKAEK
jgi:SAM-dependent methyltransferase